MTETSLADAGASANLVYLAIESGTEERFDQYSRFGHPERKIHLSKLLTDIQRQLE
jgi:hypothetical protein